MVRHRDLREPALKLAVVVSQQIQEPKMRVEPARKIMLSKFVEREFAGFSYLARQLLAFDDRQPVTGLPETIVRGAGEPENSTVTQGTSDLYWFGSS
jgi:hypothetical protein